MKLTETIINMILQKGLTYTSAMVDTDIDIPHERGEIKVHFSAKDVKIVVKEEK